MEFAWSVAINGKSSVTAGVADFTKISLQFSENKPPANIPLARVSYSLRTAPRTILPSGTPSQGAQAVSNSA
jgi:hypothetical protein